MDDLPYKVEYAKTGRAGCKGCKMNIGQDSLRIARMVQSGFHDGKQPNWFHEACFFKKQRPQTEGDIAGFESIRYDDQNRIRQKITELANVVEVVPAKGGKGKKRAASDGEVKMVGDVVKDYGIEYAKSGRAECRGCEQKILKDEVRVKKVSFDTDVGMKYGGQALWHHLECFAKLRTELGWFGAGSQLPGYKSLKADDKKATDAALPATTAVEVAQVKKPKLEIKDEVDSAHDAKLEKTLAAQNKEYFKNRDNCDNSLDKKQMIAILTKNNQDTPEGNYAILDALADLLTFGALERCSTCNGGQFVFNKANYICTGNISEWVKCESIVKEPPRRPVRIPKELTAAHKFLAGKFKVQARAVRYVPPTVALQAVKKEEALAEGPKVKRERPPLHNMEFAIIGRLTGSRTALKEAIQRLGGKLVTKAHEKLAAVIASEKEVEKMSDKMQEVKSWGVQVVREQFVEELGTDGAVEYIKAKAICDWGTDPLARIPQDEAKSKSKSHYTKSVPKSVTLTLKNGTAVDPDSGLEGEAQVLVQGKTKYFCVLGKTDIQSDKNSYYKLQLLKSEVKKNKYYIFRSWGRIGTTIGGNKLETYGDMSEAINEFKNLYSDRTGNRFGDANPKKLPGKYFPIETDYGGSEAESKLDAESAIKSELETEVQQLVKLLFDIETMKKAMVAFDLDMEKMPLGKLSQRQLSEALKVLNEISEHVRTGATSSQFIASSNQFYTMIPHDFGVRRPPIINTVEMVNTKTEMLEALMEMEFAYGLLKSDTVDEKVNPIDAHYKQLNTALRPLAHSSEEFALLEQYVRNTHAATHANFELVVEEIFAVDRAGERRRYKPFKKLHNRQLLWHGSRLTNYVGILSHGLKIAPPEAPVTGYMFGKGIYFADMVSKSANYCCTSAQNSTGLMMLCEVALGDMMECHAANYVTKLPKDKHSAKGVGKTRPDEAEAHTRKDGVVVPLGRPVTDNKLKSSLLYNEYIVYDVAQVNVQYLFKMDFKYKF